MVRQTRKKIARLPMHASTFNGLHDGYNAKFEKLGWMVLAKARGDYGKVAQYKKNIKHLLTSIQHVMNEYVDIDKQHDLHILYTNAQILLNFVMKNL
jgi:hypothetical protein